jgi:hypothetical protein
MTSDSLLRSDEPGPLLESGMQGEGGAWVRGMWPAAWIMAATRGRRLTGSTRPGQADP